MEKEKWESRLIDYLDGNLNESDVDILEHELKRNEDLQVQLEQLRNVFKSIEISPELNPSQKLGNSFSEFLKEEINSVHTKQRSMSASFYRVAAAVALLIIGGGVGFWISVQQNHSRELEAMRKEMDSTKVALMVLLKDQQSASQRLQGVNVAYRMLKADDEIVKVLVSTMNSDPNTNVRLAALDALDKFRNQVHVRKALVESLTTQTDPVVQISLIRLLVEMKEKEALEQLERITTDDEALPAVQDEAHVGILRLS